jgi:hypothetical protein
MRTMCAAMLAGMLLVVLLPGASADPLEDAADLVVDTVNGGVRTAADAAAGASRTATDLAAQSVRDGAGLVTGTVDDATATANGAIEDAGRAASDAVGQAAHAPDPLVAEANRKYDDLEQAAPLLGSYLQRRVDGVPALDTPWIQGFGDTYGPYVDQLGAAIRVSIGLHGGVGSVPDPVVVLEDPLPHLPTAEQVVGDTSDYVTGNVPGTEAWVQGTLDDTAGTARALAELATR